MSVPPAGAGASSSMRPCCEPSTRLCPEPAPVYNPPLVYAVIKTGGKQERVEEGQTLAVELLGADDGAEVSFQPLLVVDGATVIVAPDALSGTRVSARVVGEIKGPKVRGFTYKPKTRGRKAWGHRQRYTTIEITGISREG